MPSPAYTKDALQTHVEAGRLFVGPHTYGSPTLRFWAAPKGYVCRIGDYCSIADGVQIFMGGYHRPDWVTTYPFPAFEEWAGSTRVRDHAVGRGDVTIGSDVWLGSQCVIMSGVSIGHGAVVGTRAVVTKDVPPYAIVGGNPARVVKKRFDDETIAELLTIAWWNWPTERVRDNLDLLLRGDMAAFIDRNRVSPGTI